MKKLIFLICFLILSFSDYSFAQKAKKIPNKTRLTALYINFGISFKNNLYTGADLNFILSNDWGGSIAFGGIHLRARNLPRHYIRINGSKTDQLTMKSVRLKKVFPSLDPMIRFGIEAGPSLVEYQETLYQKDNRRTNTYNSSSSTKQTIGLSLLAKVEFPFLRTLGLEFAVVSNLNLLRTFVGIRFHIIIGVLHTRD